MTNKHKGSTLDSFLEEEGILEECKEKALNKVKRFLWENEDIPGVIEKNLKKELK